MNKDAGRMLLVIICQYFPCPHEVFVFCIEAVNIVRLAGASIRC